MLDLARTRHSLHRSPLSLLALVRAFLDPLTLLGCLVVVVYAYGYQFDSSYLILSLIVFSMTFPGQLSLATSPRVLMREIASGWLMILLILHFQC